MNVGASRDGASGRSPRAAFARAPTRSSPVTRSMWIVLQRSYIRIVHPNGAKNNKHTAPHRPPSSARHKARMGVCILVVESQEGPSSRTMYETHDRPPDPVCWINRLVHYVHVTRTRARFDPIRHGNTSRCRARPFIHSFIRGRRETRTRDARRGRDSSIDRTHRSFVRIDSFASIRPPRSVAHLSNAIASPDRRFAPSGPSRRARESSIEGSSIVGSRSRARARRRVARVSGVDGTIGFSFVHSFARATWTRRGRRRRRDARATRSIDARDVEASERAWIDGRGCG